MKTQRRIYHLFSAVVVLSLLALPACTEKPSATPLTTEEGQPATSEEAGTTAPIEYETMTDVGTPRAETLIVDQGYGAVADPGNFNPFTAGNISSAGLLQLSQSYLWEIDTTTGEQFPAMAAEPIKVLDDTFTKWEIKLKEGLYWSDGVEITADDIVFSIGLYFANPSITTSSVITTYLKNNAQAVDKYTVHIETNMPAPRLQQYLGVLSVSSSFLVVPKHIWENVDVLTYQNNPPVGAGPYVLSEYDTTNGSWYLWERREDWDRTDVGMIEGMPTPEYILFKAYGTEEKRVLAAINNDLDVLFDITTESWEILHESNPTTQAWYNDFPWAEFDDPCERGMMLNWAVEPYNEIEVRWALALATDMVSVTLATFDGMLRVSPLAVPPIEILQQAYHLPMEEWLEEFTLIDGYQPFDPDYAVKIADALKQNGVEGIPEDEDELKALFGVGWWKYDVEEAARLLESVGFTRDAEGKWLFPDGTPWQINIISPVNYEALSERLSYAVAESWSNFGIDAVVNGMDTGSWSSAIMTGSYEVANHWNGACASITDIFTGGMMNWHSVYLRPIGVPGGLNPSRVNSAEVDAALDALKMVSSNHPQLVELSTDFLEEMVTEMVWIPMVGTSKFVPVTTQWWTGFPNADNYYNGPWWWWSAFKYILPHLETTGNL